MFSHQVRSLVSGAFVIATFAGASNALAHGVVPYPAPRDLQYDDTLEWTADVVGVTVETTKSDVTVTTTVPEGLPYIHAIEILLFCSDGTTAHLTQEEGWVIEGSAQVTRSCANGVTFEAAGVTVYAVDDHSGEGAEEEQSGDGTEVDDSGKGDAEEGSDAER